MIPQLAASSFGILKKCRRNEIVANCEPPPTPGNCTREPTMLEPMSSKSWEIGMLSTATPYPWVTSQYATAIRNHIRTETRVSCASYGAVNRVQSFAKLSNPDANLMSEGGTDM